MDEKEIELLEKKIDLLERILELKKEIKKAEEQPATVPQPYSPPYWLPQPIVPWYPGYTYRPLPWFPETWSETLCDGSDMQDYYLYGAMYEVT